MEYSQNYSMEPGSAPLAKRSHRVILAFTLVALTFFAYWPALHNDFVDFDDWDYVVKNPHVNTGLTLDNVKWAFRALEVANWHPLAWLSHMLDSQLYGLHPMGHHLSSIALQALNAVVLFLLLLAVTGYLYRSFFVAALFAIHPLNVETVVWISERKSILSLFFSLVAVGLYARYARNRTGKNYALVALAFALALMSKPMAVTLPAIFLLLDYWPLQRIAIPAAGVSGESFLARATQLIVEKIPFFLMTLISCVVTFIAQKRGSAMGNLARLPFSERAANAAYSYVKYISKLFWPNPLAYFYPHPGANLSMWKVVVACLVLVAVTIFVWKLRSKRYLVFGWGLFLVTLVPVVGLVQVGMQGMADRYAYVPFIGLFIMLVWGLADLCAAMKVSPVSLGAVGGCALLAFALASRSNSLNWRDSLTLYTHAAAVSPQPVAYIEINLGAVLNDQGNIPEALKHFQIAEVLEPNKFTTHYNVGYALLQLGQTKEAAAELEIALSKTKEPFFQAKAVNNLAVAYLDLGRNEDAAKAFSRYLELKPDSVAGLVGRGQSLYNLGKYQEASKDFLAAVQMKPAAELYLMAGKSLEAAGSLDAALQQYQSAIKADGNLEEAKQKWNDLQKKLKK